MPGRSGKPARPRPLRFTLNGRTVACEVFPHTILLDLLREQRCFSVKFSDEWGEGGADTIFLDGRLVSAATHLALQAEGRSIETLEGLRESPDLKRLAETFLDEGAVQCGYCTPATLMALEALRRRNPNPDEAGIRAALAGVFCRCTGYAKPVRAALVNAGRAAPRVPIASDPALRIVGHDTRRVDGAALVSGAPVFAADETPSGALHLKVLHSPLPHARIKGISTEKARAIPGVVDIATWHDAPRVVYTTAGQGFPEPSP